MRRLALALLVACSKPKPQPTLIVDATVPDAAIVDAGFHRPVLGADYDIHDAVSRGRIVIAATDQGLVELAPSAPPRVIASFDGAFARELAVQENFAFVGLFDSESEPWGRVVRISLSSGEKEVVLPKVPLVRFRLLTTKSRVAVLAGRSLEPKDGAEITIFEPPKAKAQFKVELPSSSKSKGWVIENALASNRFEQQNGIVWLERGPKSTPDTAVGPKTFPMRITWFNDDAMQESPPKPLPLETLSSRPDINSGLFVSNGEAIVRVDHEQHIETVADLPGRRDELDLLGNGWFLCASDAAGVGGVIVTDKRRNAAPVTYKDFDRCLAAEKTAFLVKKMGTKGATWIPATQ